MTAGLTLLVGAIATEQDAHEVVSVSAERFIRAQLDTRFTTIVLGSGVLDVGFHHQRLITHNCAVHLGPGGSLVVNDPPHGYAEHATACGFISLDAAGRRWQRTERRTIHDVVAEARAGYDRTTADELAKALEHRPGESLVVDVRNADDRHRFGVIAGSVAIPRPVLEWRIDPTSGYTARDVPAFEQQLVVVCNEGYSSSLAAATLQGFGFAGVSDLVGGMVAWLDAGHPVVAAPPGDDGFIPVEALDRDPPT